MDRVGEAESTEGVVTPGTVADVVLLAAVPVVLLAVATLPASVRQSFVFAYEEPTLRTAVVSSFVHLGPGHLAVNLLTYALVVPVGYLLSAVNGEQRRF